MCPAARGQCLRAGSFLSYHRARASALGRAYLASDAVLDVQAQNVGRAGGRLVQQHGCSRVEWTTYQDRTDAQPSL